MICFSTIKLANVSNSYIPISILFALDKDDILLLMKNEVDSAVTLAANFLNRVALPTICVGYELFEFFPREVVQILFLSNGPNAHLTLMPQERAEKCVHNE